MKRQIATLAAVGTMAAGMIFAQGQTTAPAPRAQQNQLQHNQGQNRVEGRNHRGEWRQRMAAGLNLTPSQKEMARTIFGQAREQAKPVRMELRQNREAFAAAIKSDNKAQIEKLSAQRGQLMAKMSANRGEAMAKFYQVLTPAQGAKADQMHQRFEAHMRQLRNEHRGTRANG
jgi:Spy/CpxP family protein refolding chaperone